MPGFIRRRHAPVTLGIVVLAAVAALSAQDAADPSPFRESEAWSTANGITSRRADAKPEPLYTQAWLGDAVIEMEYRAPVGVQGTLYVMSRYAVALPGAGLGEDSWRRVSVRFRSTRFDETLRKTENALLLEARVGTQIIRNQIFGELSAGAPQDDEQSRGVSAIDAERAPFEVRNFRLAPADFSAVTLPAASGGETNENTLVDFVALGKETFEAVGCSACHLVEPPAAAQSSAAGTPTETAVSSGPNLFGLMTPEPRNREVVEGEGHRFNIQAGRPYLHRSVRAPAEQLAVAENGARRGEAYLPVMPAFSAEVLSDEQIDAIGAYLATLNPPYQQGPVVKLLARGSAEVYDPMTDRLQWLVDDVVRIQRGPLPGVSGRGIHVGNPDGVNYSFDPRVLAITKIWQGGFLDMKGELTNRGGGGLKLGHESRELGFGEREFLMAPLNAHGERIDFSFKEAKFGDTETIRASLHSKQDHLPRLAALDAQFLGYSRDSTDKLVNPSFRYRVGTNTLDVRTSIAADGTVRILVQGELAASQSFAINPALLREPAVSAGTLQGDRWTLAAGKTTATLSASMPLAANAWRPAKSTYDHRRAPALVKQATAKLPAGYSIESFYPPKDNYGREQLFEALGLSLSKDGTVVVATRTAGIWRLVNNEWRLFAEGLFDSLGVVAEDKKGLVVVVGQKAELTRISDVNGDGLADRFDTLFDAHSYHGNYHTYMHGPVRGADGAYYFALNLAHDFTNSTYNAGGAYMGTWGGFNGWSFRVEPDGKFSTWAHGLRSPASLGAAPDGRLWYADNQGEYVGTSKMFVLQQGKFYGHPASLVDLPGRTPESPESAWEKVSATRERPVILFPHNRVANSPGNPVWDTTRGRFGPFAGQILIGDQTQSNLLRVSVQQVNGVEQGAVMPFIEGLESGVMRPLFLPDGSLLLGQTGRGWQAKGGNVASLQRIRWDGKTVAPAIAQMLATPRGFRIQLTRALGKGVTAAQVQAALSMESWTYRDAPQYGSDELAQRSDGVASIVIAADRRSFDIELASIEVPSVHPQQTARVYHAKLGSKDLFGANAPAQMDAYYTLYAFPHERPGVLRRTSGEPRGF